MEYITLTIGFILGYFLCGVISTASNYDKNHISELDADHRASLILSYMKQDKSDKEIKTEIKRIIRL